MCRVRWRSGFRYWTEGHQWSKWSESAFSVCSTTVRRKYHFAPCKTQWFAADDSPVTSKSTIFSPKCVRCTKGTKTWWLLNDVHKNPGHILGLNIRWDQICLHLPRKPGTRWLGSARTWLTFLCGKIGYCFKSPNCVFWVPFYVYYSVAQSSILENTSQSFFDLGSDFFCLLFKGWLRRRFANSSSVELIYM